MLEHLLLLKFLVIKPLPTAGQVHSHGRNAIRLAKKLNEAVGSAISLALHLIRSSALSRKNKLGSAM